MKPGFQRVRTRWNPGFMPGFSLADLLGRLLAPGSRLVAADLVLQRAVVRKYAARRVRGFQLAVGAALPRRAFRPPPRVDSAVLVIRRQPR